jgi:hypothetical protein
MKSYPSICKEIMDVPVYVFDKLDGSNIRAEWDKKKGFWKFGSRNVLLDKSHEFLGSSVDLIKSQEEQFMKTVNENKWLKGVAFFEFYGLNSFAGFHVKEDPKKVTLIDIMPFNEGILNPDEFYNLFHGIIDVPRLICWAGRINSYSIEEIKTRRQGGITFEGVVCKAKKKKKIDTPFMFKIKTYDWLNKLKNHCKDDEKLFRNLE